MSKDKLTIGTILFPGYDLLDVNGTLRMLGSLENVKILMISQNGDKVTSNCQVANYADYTFDNCPEFNVLFVPGGIGTRSEVNNPILMEFIKKQIPKVKYVLVVCTGGGLVSKTGLLDGKRATSNKLAWEWVTSQGPNVLWVKKARWVVDGKFYTSAGVSAGMDMALGFISDVYGKEIANKIASKTEYDWHDNPDWDPFSDKILEKNI
ncbi:ThiJ/PfpI domain-containing protein [Glomus cerebriforme]|uniref:ThiJ/PfpI domain-containing protein n=1 Tax=Glomus cerebriforme TaxID=658196 RepID=A0A397TDW1_9GLOM|nr:ThiJ/PfpI domain-containing protein [Glomus cerebriforme]